MRRINKYIQKIVDKIHGKPVDIISTVGYIGLSLIIVYFTFWISELIRNPILKRPINPIIFTLIIFLPITLFYLTMIGDFYRKPSRRIIQFRFVLLSTAFFAFVYLVQVANMSFVNGLKNINNIEVIPFSLLQTNIKISTFVIPGGIILIILIPILKTFTDQNVKNELIEYEIEFLLPSVHKMNKTTLDLTICEDIRTGENCTVPEKITFEHTWLQGGTGSGKTATYIRPMLKQLFEIRGQLREAQKKIAFECLTEGIAYLTAPVSNYYFNNNFSMELIKPKKGKEEEFKERFKDYIIGVRDKETLIINHEAYNGGNIEIDFKGDDNKYHVDIVLNEYGQDVGSLNVVLDNNKYEGTFNLKDDINVTISKTVTESEFSKMINNNNSDIDINQMTKNNKVLQNDDKDKLTISLPKTQDYSFYRIKIYEKGNGNIIYKGVGVTVIAPDGELAKDTIKIAEKFNNKVHKIDPSMEEIKKGVVECFNPLAEGSPEKVGDIVSSILISMEQLPGTKSNPYFTNASVRAVRNLIILLMVMHPKMENEAPTLEDVLRILNNFSQAIPYVEEMKKDAYLSERWKSVIDYFEGSFYPPPVDDSGRVIMGSKIGNQYKKTKEAIGGIQNQLDNFIGREEIRYILCNRKKSLKLKHILEKGECIAVSTRTSELGERLGKAFALFFILSLQNEILCRYSENENPEIPHHLIIDEFPFYVNDSTKVFFTFARKYKCAVTIAIQDMDQLKEVSDAFGKTIFTNTSTKMLLPKSNVDDRMYWSDFFGTEKEIEMQTGYSVSNKNTFNPSYSENVRGTLKDKQKISTQDINDLKFEQAFYSYTDYKGRQRTGKGKTSIMKISSIKEMDSKEYNFEDFNTITLKEHYMNKKKDNSKKGDSTKNTNDTNEQINDIQINDELLQQALNENLGNDNTNSSAAAPQIEINLDSLSNIGEIGEDGITRASDNKNNEKINLNNSDEKINLNGIDDKVKDEGNRENNSINNERINLNIVEEEYTTQSNTSSENANTNMDKERGDKEESNIKENNEVIPKVEEYKNENIAISISNDISVDNDSFVNENVDKDNEITKNENRENLIFNDNFDKPIQGGIKQSDPNDELNQLNNDTILSFNLDEEVNEDIDVKVQN